MSNFVDFGELKDRIGFGQVLALLNLPMKKAGNQWRGACPACQKGGDRALVVTDGKAFFCFAAHKGGDQITLAAHIRGCSVKEAAQFIAEGYGISSNTSTSTVGTVPESTRADEGKNLTPLGYLEHDHQAVLAVGFDPAVAKRLGVGYAPKGIMRGTVAVPIRDAHGAIQGYIGVESARLPPDFMTNIVPFGKKSA